MIDKFFKIKPLMFVVLGLFAFSCFHIHGASHQITIGSAQIDDSKPNGKSWDAFNGLPDAFVKVFVNGNMQFSTSVKKDTCTPEWNETFTINFNDGDKIVIEMWDEDMASNDLIGRWKSTELPGGEISHGSFRNLKVSIN